MIKEDEYVPMICDACAHIEYRFRPWLGYCRKQGHEVYINNQRCELFAPKFDAISRALRNLMYQKER